MTKVDIAIKPTETQISYLSGNYKLGGGWSQKYITFRMEGGKV